MTQSASFSGVWWCRRHQRSAVSMLTAAFCLGLCCWRTRIYVRLFRRPPNNALCSPAVIWLDHPSTPFTPYRGFLRSLPYQYAYSFHCPPARMRREQIPARDPPPTVSAHTTTAIAMADVPMAEPVVLADVLSDYSPGLYSLGSTYNVLSGNYADSKSTMQQVVDWTKSGPRFQG
ncbi:hypothetical protein BC835DRAFT_875736 [Cytidiella melzeri]|nr:hypothetical protein BC835DRAFT_875736 [Cytidiella melzeri]